MIQTFCNSLWILAMSSSAMRYGSSIRAEKTRSAGDLAVVSGFCTMKLLHTLAQCFWAPPAALPWLSCLSSKQQNSCFTKECSLCAPGPCHLRMYGKPVCTRQISSTHFPAFCRRNLRIFYISHAN